MEYKNCPVGKYHWFKVLSSNELAQKERCKFCGKEEAYRFRSDGQLVDDHQYFLDHIRAFCQPHMGDVYYECNPGMKTKFEAEASRLKKNEDRKEELTDKFKFAMKRAFDDRDDGIKKK